MRRTAAFVLALALAAPAAARAGEPAPASGPRPETREPMGEIFEAMAYLLPLSLDDKKWVDPKRRDKILEALAVLERSSAQLASHGGKKDAAFAHLSRSLAHDSRDIRQRYAEGYVLEARFLVQQLTETCVACHSRLHSDKDSSLSERFVRESAVSDLPLDQRAKLEYATRQFDRALDTYEQLFASPAASPSDLDLMGDFDDYLELCIHVRGDLQRPVRTLEKFLKRTDVPAPLRSEIERWIGSLKELQGRKRLASPIADARQLIAEAQDMQRFADEREGLVFYLQASAELQAYVAAHPDGGRDAAEAYYLLGLIETRIGRSFWLSQAESFLETAIRLAPGAPVAQDAYALLEDYLVAGYTGSAGENVPPDVQAKLDELRKLIDRASSGSGKAKASPAPEPDPM